MRRIGLPLAAAALVVSVGAATASSIQAVHGSSNSNNSIISVTCKGCPPVGPKTRPDQDAVVDLPAGTQTVSTRLIDGQTQTVRREAWLGGSPVTFVSTNPIWLPVPDATAPVPDQPPALDTTARTASTIPEDAPVLVDGDAALASIAGIEALTLRPSH